MRLTCSATLNVRCLDAMGCPCADSNLMRVERSSVDMINNSCRLMINISNMDPMPSILFDPIPRKVME